MPKRKKATTPKRYANKIDKASVKSKSAKGGKGGRTRGDRYGLSI